jgi:hypothetical protein
MDHRPGQGLCFFCAWMGEGDPGGRARLALLERCAGRNRIRTVKDLDEDFEESD